MGTLTVDNVLLSYLKGVSIVNSTFIAFIRVLSVSYFIYF